MGFLYLLIGLGALVLIAFVYTSVRGLSRGHRLPFVADKTLFTPAQKAFLTVLERAVGRGYRIYGRVRVADLIGVRRRLDRRSRRRAFARLADRSFDFVVCTAETGSIACAVNLAPRSRLGLRPPRDGLDRICEAAGLPFVRFREGEPYSVVEIEERVFAAMQARRIVARAEEPSRRETQEVLSELSETIADDGRQARRAPAPKREPALAPRPIRQTHPSRPAGARPQPTPQPALVPRPAASLAAGPEPGAAQPRIDPHLPERSLGEEGPTFTISDDLEVEESPARLRLV